METCVPDDVSQQQKHKKTATLKDLKPIFHGVNRQLYDTTETMVIFKE